MIEKESKQIDVNMDTVCEREREQTDGERLKDTDMGDTERVREKEIDRRIERERGKETQMRDTERLREKEIDR